MQRTRLQWPLDRGAQLWIAKQARKNLWRVITPSYDLDDLIQDAYFKWYHVNNKYPDIAERRHFMSLFQVAFLNHIQLMATRRTKQAALNCEYDETTMSEIVRDEELATMQVLCGQAPEPIKKVLRLLASDKGAKRLRSLQRIRIVKKGEKPKLKLKETIGERLCRLCQLDPGTDIAGMIHAHFSD